MRKKDKRKSPTTDEGKLPKIVLDYLRYASLDKQKIHSEMFGVKILNSIKSTADKYLESLLPSKQSLLNIIAEHNRGFFKTMIGKPPPFYEALTNLHKGDRQKGRSLWEVLDIVNKFENSPGGLLWLSVINKDDKAARNLLELDQIRRLIKKEVNRINQVMQLDRDQRLSQTEGESLAYLAIKDAQQWYSTHPEKAKRYDGWDVPFRDLVKRMPELFKRAFFFRLTKKIGKEIEQSRYKGLSKLIYRHPGTGEYYMFLKDAATSLGLSERQLRYRINTGKIPEDCYCTFNDLEGRDYYHRLTRQRVSPIMIPVDRLNKIRNILQSHKESRICIDNKTYIPIGKVAEFIAQKRGIQVSSAKKFLKRNSINFGGKLHNGRWWFPEKRFTKKHAFS